MQTKYSFDKETVLKIGKGALIAATGAGTLYVLDLLGKVQIDQPFLAAFLVWFVPVAVNTIKEWMRGE